MRAWDIMGKRVARVKQQRIVPREGEGDKTPDWSLDAVVFTDGTELWFTARESEVEPYVIGTVMRRKR